MGRNVKPRREVKGYDKNAGNGLASGERGAILPPRMKKFALMGLFLAGGLLGAAPSGWAVQVRIASYNVYFGLDTGSDRGEGKPDDDYAAVLATMQRVRPDIVCFQELTSSDQAAWVQMAGTLGFPYYAFASQSGGTFAGTVRLGIWSKFPILASAEVKETVVDPTAAEMSRWPLHAVIQVPGALNPLHVFSVHNKSSTTSKRDRMRRALEIRRLVNYIGALTTQYPLDCEYAVMGDFNDTIEGSIGLGQTTNFPKSYYDAQAGSLPASFKAGSDTPWYTNANWLLPYRYYPTDRLGVVGMSAVPARHTGGTNTWTHAHTDGTGYRLDYLLFSDEITQSAYGAPQAEVYNSAGDAANVGLAKYGSPLPANTSSNASDHRMIFADFHLIDEVAGMTPVAIISEIVDHPASTNGNYVEICNTGNGSLDLAAYQVAIYVDKATRATATFSLSGTLAAGAVYTLAASTNIYRQLYGVTANQQAVALGRLNGNDAVALLRSNAVADVFGAIGSYPGAWGYTNATAVRRSGISEPLPTWSAAEWTITAGTNAATPGRHQAVADADVSISSLALDPAVPRATNSFAIAANVAGNVSASNFVVWAYFRIASGAWISNAMTNAEANLWRTPQLNVAKSGNDVLDYYVRAQFAGPGNNSPKNSSTNHYTFPPGSDTDRDGDGIPDYRDNCPDTFNPTQIDTDGDGIGDECDNDIDGDGVLNAVDNCPYTYNPDQADLDGDGIGDECDDDIDGDGLFNEDDPDPYTPNTLQVTFEEGNKPAYAAATVQLSGRSWVLTNALIPTGGLLTTNDRYNGTRGCRIRAPGAVVLEGPLANGIGELSFAYAQYSGDVVSLIAQYRKEGDWVTISSNNTTGVANLATNRVTANVLGPVEFRILCEGGKDKRASLDDMVISSFTLPDEEMDAQCAVSGATEVEYNGALRTNDFIVYPEGIPYSVVYSPATPLNAGSYTATVTIPSTNQITGGVFVFPNSLVITKATPSCVLNAAVQTSYDGASHTNRFTVTPPELAWSVAYSPENPPVNVGAYEATVTIDGNSNWFDHEVAFPNAVVIGDSLPGAPQPHVILTNQTLFTVAWATIPNAVSYRVDVSTNASFGSAGGAVYTVDFEDGTKTSFAEGDITLNGKSWKLAEALIGSLAGDRRNGQKAARVRYNEPEYGTGIMTMNEDLSSGLSAVTLLHGKYGNDADTAGRVDYSSNGGASWVSVGEFTVTATTLTPFSVTNLNVAGNVRLRVVKTSGNDTTRFNIDDIQIHPYTPGGSFVAGYSNRNVTGASQVVTGLLAGATYYVRVAAISTAGQGAFSPVISVITRTSEAPGSPFEQWLANRGHDPQAANYAAEADTDGDGMTTWQEYLADTDPADSNSVLRLTGTLSIAEGRLRWTFPQSVARYYQVEYSTNLAQGVAISNLGWGVPGRVITNTIPGAGEWFWGIRSYLNAP